MTDKNYDVEYLEVGDTFDGGPIEQSYFISAVMAAGGEVWIDGTVVHISALPKKEAPAKAPVSSGYIQVVDPEPVLENTPEPVEDAPLVDIAAEEAVIEAPKPAAKPGPKPKAVPAAETEKE